MSLEEGLQQSSWEEQKKKGLMAQEGFHLDPSKSTDPVEKLIADLGTEDDAFDTLMARLEKNPDDAEARRQANLLVNRVDDLKKVVDQLRTKIQH